ncbi:ABC transporter ATP-binding protein [Formosa sp. PL04]|uniref:ABC transporter ATP-binding protein n=1 Tax=Formosa sp. PL04 TaxID=3081755 RepID=UPI0029822017|nr:ABC transporter ATP-binding protein [Formosa sp. PL04]MDW5290755.1 ABC transporter ATP-binding protein [Formosa sp. PL04]
MTILKAENISKQYRLGLIGTGTISHDLNRWWHRVRGKDDPYLKIGEVNDRSSTGKSEYAWALRDINFEVQQGEVLGIIGKNGAGKSTLLKILSRVTSPTTGEIKTRGRIASLLEVGTGFHPELTGRENIYLNGAILGMTKAEIKDKEAEIIEFSGCARYVDTPVKRYSSGMRVRLAFAVAAFLEPDILVIDEVLAVGDAEFQKKAIGKMQDISKGDGRTVLFVSHNMAAVKSLCTRAVVLEHGTSVFEGETDEAVSFYINNKMSKPMVYEDFDKSFGICKVEFLNSKNQRIDNALVGQEVRLKVSYKNPEERILSISLGFYNEYDDFLFGCRSDVINKSYSEKEGEAILSIEKWPISKGVYTYNTSIHESNISLEHMVSIGQIVIEEGDFYGFGKLPAANKKGFYTNYKWI